MRFIQAIVDGFKLRLVTFPSGTATIADYTNLISYKYLGDKMSLLEFNNYIKTDNIKSLIDDNYMSLPLLTHVDMDTLRQRGYGVISRIGKNLIESEFE